MIGICRATAGAVELCPAVLAFGTAVSVAACEPVAEFRVLNAVVDITHLVCVVADELVAGIEVAPRCDGEILCAGAAACDPLIDAGTACEVEHIVVEGKRSAFLKAPDHKSCKLFVLLENYGQVFFGYRRRAGRFCNYRFH